MSGMTDTLRAVAERLDVTECDCPRRGTRRRVAHTALCEATRDYVASIRALEEAVGAWLADRSDPEAIQSLDLASELCELTQARHERARRRHHGGR